MRPSGKRLETRISKFDIAMLLIACVFSGLALSQPGQAAAAEGTAGGNRPYAYLFPAELRGLTAYLQKSEVEICELREDIELDVNVYHIEQVTYEQSRHVRGRIATLKTRPEKQTRRVQAVLPPLQESRAYPIMTLDSYVPVTQGPVRPLSETRRVNRPITFDTIYGEADWVYFEEVWLRQWKQSWWSADSSSIAFLQVDDAPQKNPDGYDRTSVIKAAANLHGRLLIIHGGIDDNVHMENTLKLVDALQRADKEFQLMVYPESRHGVGGMHYHRLVVNVMKSVLQLPDKEGSQ